MNDCKVIAVQCADCGLDFSLYFTVSQTETVGDNSVENYIGVGVAGYHAEIVDVDFIINAVDQCRNASFSLVGRSIVHHDGIHMNDRVAAQLFLQFLFHIVDLIVDYKDIIVGRNFELTKKKLYINSCNIVDIRELLQSSDVTIKIRGIGRNPELPVTIKPCDGGYVIIAQDEVYAPAKGQPLVFYRNNLVIGGGIVVDFD